MDEHKDGIDQQENPKPELQIIGSTDNTENIEETQELDEDFDEIKVDMSEIKREYSFTGMWIGIGMLFGISIGHLVFDNIPTGMLVGMCVGLLLSTVVGRKK